MTSSTLRGLLVLLLFLAPAPGRAGESDEASRLRVLLVLDTDDRLGDTWGLDGANLRALLEAGLKRQKLAGRTTIDVFTGQQASPAAILHYYAQLRVAPDETLLFYYSGHGSYHRKKGHYLALTHGPLYRADLLAALQKQPCRAVVLLTDCCSNLAGGALEVEPPAVQTASIRGDGKQQRRATTTEPPSQVKALPTQQRKPPADLRPDTVALLRGKKARQEEPSGARELAGTARLQPNRPKARQEAPAESTFAVQRATMLTTTGGRVPLAEVVAKSDGIVLRHLLFRAKGLVDINGCAIGHFSHGMTAWGGSLFTIAFVALQQKNVAAFDRDGNHFVEWSEFFPYWQRETAATGTLVGRGRIDQVPTATKLGQ